MFHLFSTLVQRLRLSSRKKLNFSIRFIAKQNKTMFFILFIAKQCSLINNNSKLPTNFIYLTEKRLGNVIFSIDEIGCIIRGLDPNKAYVQD